MGLFLLSAVRSFFVYCLSSSSCLNALIALTVDVPCTSPLHQILPRKQEAPGDKNSHVPPEPVFEYSGLAFRVVAMVPAEVWPTVSRPKVRRYHRRVFHSHKDDGLFVALAMISTLLRGLEVVN